MKSSATVVMKLSGKLIQSSPRTRGSTSSTTSRLTVPAHQRARPKGARSPLWVVLM